MLFCYLTAQHQPEQGVSSYFMEQLVGYDRDNSQYYKVIKTLIQMNALDPTIGLCDPQRQVQHTEPCSLPLTLLLWMFCRCFTVISRMSAFSSLDCCWETSSLGVNLIRSPLFTCGGDETRAEILTSSLNAPITVSFSWSKQLFILSRRFLSMSGFLSCKGKNK